MIHRYRMLTGVIFAVVVMFGLVACSGADPTPIIVYVTATPDTTAELNVSTPVSGLIPTTPPEITPSIATEEQKIDQPASNDVLVSETQSAQIATATAAITPTATLEVTATVTPIPSNTPPPTATFTPSPTPDIPPTELLPLIDRHKFGIQLHPFLTGDEWDYTLVHTDAIGAFGWIKIQLPWKELQPAPGRYSDLFYAYALRVQSATYQTGRPYKVLLSVVKAPAWARGPNADLSQDGPGADPQYLARFLTDFINETKPEDHRIGAIEIWNEPNLAREWTGQEISGQKYMEHFRVAYDAIKAIDPTITIITAGLAPVGDVQGQVSDRVFLQQMYDAGLANYPDVKVGIHPYGWGNPPDETCCQNPPPRGWADNRVFFFKDTLDDYLRIMQQNDHASQLWITEFGWGTYEDILMGWEDLPAPPAALQFDLVTARQQAEYTVRAFEMLQSPPYADSVGVAILWNLNFATLSEAVANGQEQAGYSLLNSAGEGRYIYYYLQNAPKVPEE